jgi:hypothetical protein
MRKEGIIIYHMRNFLPFVVRHCKITVSFWAERNTASLVFLIWIQAINFDTIAWE